MVERAVAMQGMEILAGAISTILEGAVEVAIRRSEDLIGYQATAGSLQSAASDVVTLAAAMVVLGGHASIGIRRD